MLVTPAAECRIPQYLNNVRNRLKLRAKPPCFFCRALRRRTVVIHTRSPSRRWLLAPIAATLAAWLALSVAPLQAQSGPPQQDSAELPRVKLQVGERRITAEVAADDASRSRGLMFREQLPSDHGMLFVFPEPSQMCFWMKNTVVPLTVAFIDPRGDIVNLADMQPQSLETHCAIAPAQYALEMEQGWFKRHGAGPGTHVSGLPVLKRRRP